VVMLLNRSRAVGSRERLNPRVGTSVSDSIIFLEWPRKVSRKDSVISNLQLKRIIDWDCESPNMAKELRNYWEMKLYLMHLPLCENQSLVSCGRLSGTPGQNLGNEDDIPMVMALPL
jgi:hypothetical protein